MDAGDGLVADHPVLAGAVDERPAGGDAGQAARDGADAEQLEGDLAVHAGHQAGGQGDLLVLAAAAVRQLRHPLRVIEGGRVPLEVVEVGEQLLLPGHPSTLPRMT